MPSKLCSRSHQEHIRINSRCKTRAFAVGRIKKVSKLVRGTPFAELATYATLPSQATIGKGNSRAAAYHNDRLF